MSITYGDVARLGDRPGVPGVLSKLNELAGDASLAGQIPVVERYRIMKFVQLVSAELSTYGKLMTEIGRKYGEPTTGPSGFASFNLRPENVKDYEAEKAALDALECGDLGSLKPLPVATYEKIPLTPRELSFLQKFVVLPDGV
jgi:hypothetical protein